MRSICVYVAAAAMMLAACGGGGSGGGQPQTEQGAIDAVKSATEGALRGNTGAVLNFLSKECRDSVDAQEVQFALALVQAFFGDAVDGVDLDAIRVEPTIVSFDGDTARVSAAYVTPDGSDLDTLGLSTDTVSVEYEDGKWVDTGCDFEDTTQADADRLAEGLAALGYEATREDPIPRSVAAPVGQGFVVSVDAIDTDASDAIEAMGGFASEPEPGERFVLVSLTVGFDGPDEPESLSNLTVQLIGGSSAIGIDDSYACGSFPSELTGKALRLFRGGATTGDVCFPVPTAEIDGLQLAFEGGFSTDRKVIFDPAVAADAPVPFVASTGPHPDGDYTAARNAPRPAGEPVGLGEGWTITVDGLRDATSEILATSESNDPPPDGYVYGLLTYQLTYDGEEQSGSAFSVDIHIVGDSNVSADRNCGVFNVPDEIDRFSDVFQGGSVAGTECFLVAEGDLDSVVVFASASFFGDDAFAIAVR